MVAQTAAFTKAVGDSRKLKAKPTNDELLEVRLALFQARVSERILIWCYPVIQLYANYKQGMGEDFSKATPAGTFDFQVRDNPPLPMPFDAHPC